MAVEILRIISYKLQRVPKTLIIVPVVVLENWKREIIAHSYIEESNIQVVDGVTKFGGTKLKNPSRKLKQQQVASYKDIFIISTQTVDGKKDSLWQDIKKLGFETLIIDEVHNFKKYNGKRVKALHSLTHDRNLKYRYILTGTPVLQDALDLWSQFYILNPHILGANFFQFRAKYFYDKNAGMPSARHFPDWQPKDEKYFSDFGYNANEDLKTLNKVIYQHANRVMKTDVLELPKLEYETVTVPMEGEHKRIYEEFRKDLVAFIKKPKKSKKQLEEELLAIDLEEFELPELMKADLAIVKTIRLQQLIAGIFTSTEGEVTLLETRRLEFLEHALKAVCLDPNNKVIIWTVFSPTYTQISDLCTKLGIKHVFMTGQQDQQGKLASEDTFREDPEVRVIIANQGAGGTGVNLTSANYAFYYTRSFNLGHDLQSEARNNRGGQTREMKRVDFITPDTIDQRVLERLKEKKLNAEDILRSYEFKSKEVQDLV